MGGARGAAGKPCTGLSGQRGPGNKTYLYGLTDVAASVLTVTDLQDVQKISGADAQLDTNPSPVRGMKVIIIRGHPSQIEAAVKLISQKSGTQGTISEQAEAFFLEWLEDSFPDLDSRAYFLPPVYINRVLMISEKVAGEQVYVLQQADGKASQASQTSQASQPTTAPSAAASTPSCQLVRIQDSDIRDDAAMQRLFLCLQKMADEEKEIFFAMSQLSFGDYLDEPCYAAAFAQLPRPSTLDSSLPSSWKKGDFDVLVIHRHYGFVIFEVKAFGDNIQNLKMPQQEINFNIRKKLKEAASQLDKAEAMLSHLVSDFAPGLRITKTMAFPNLKVTQVQQAIAGEQELEQDLCRCLGVSDPNVITGFCVWSDELLEPKSLKDTPKDVDAKLTSWWQRRVSGLGPDNHMTFDMYKKIVARFCGPATTMTVSCMSPPRRCLKTLGEGVSWTGECYAQLTLFPEQVDLLDTAAWRVFLAGPPGTGKSIMLQLMGTEWLRHGNAVHIVATCRESYAACRLLLHELQIALNKLTPAAQPAPPATSTRLDLHRYDFHKEEDIEKAVNDLTQAASGGLLHVMADEVGPDWKQRHFHNFCDKLLAQIPKLHFWAANCYHRHAPKNWQVEYMTRSLRSPPVVRREVELDATILRLGDVKAYDQREVPEHTDGPAVQTVYHYGEGHSQGFIEDCVKCGEEVARFLHSLRADTARVSATPGACTTSRIRWRDVLVLSRDTVNDNWSFLTGLRLTNIPVKVVTSDDDIDDVVTGSSKDDVVWVADGSQIRGLERPVIVALWNVVNTFVRLHIIARCSSQLVLVSHCSAPEEPCSDSQINDSSSW